MHIVCMKQSIQNAQSAIQVSDGLAVLGFFFEVSKDIRQELNAYTHARARVRKHTQSRNVCLYTHKVLH